MHPERFLRQFSEHVLPDLRDNLASSATPERRETREERHDALLERLVPLETRNAIMQGTPELAVGERIRARTLVGTKEDQTRHPHDFTIERLPEGLRLTFVDPEHYIGRRGSLEALSDIPHIRTPHVLRPKIGNLMTASLPLDPEQRARIALLRFRTERIPDPAVFKLHAQQEAADHLIEDFGIPSFLTELPTEILFRIVLDTERAVVQARYTNENEIDAFLKGGRGSSALEGKVRSQQQILGRFPEYLASGLFKSVHAEGSH